MKINNRLLVATGLAASALTAQAALTTLDSSAFANTYNGDEIFDGAATINGWAAAGGATNANLTLNGSNVVSTLTDTNGWLQHDNGSTPWESGNGSWTVEVRANMSATGTGGLNIWGALNGERDIMTIRENQVSNLGGTVYNTESNTGAFHNFRLAYDAAGDVYHYFRDGVQITPLGGVSSPAGRNRQHPPDRRRLLHQRRGKHRRCLRWPWQFGRIRLHPLRQHRRLLPNPRALDHRILRSRRPRLPPPPPPLDRHHGELYVSQLAC